MLDCASVLQGNGTRMVSKQVGKLTGGTRVPRGVAFTMGVYSDRCASEAKGLRSAVPDSKPLRALIKGRDGRSSRKYWRTRTGRLTGESVR